MKISLEEWAARNYSPAPPYRTVRDWAKTGQIDPRPEKVGRILMVEETAKRVPLALNLSANDAQGLSPRALGILARQAA